MPAYVLRRDVLEEFDLGGRRCKPYTCYLLKAPRDSFLGTFEWTTRRADAKAMSRRGADTLLRQLRQRARRSERLSLEPAAVKVAS